MNPLKKEIIKVIEKWNDSPERVGNYISILHDVRFTDLRFRLKSHYAFDEPSFKKFVKFFKENLNKEKIGVNFVDRYNLSGSYNFLNWYIWKLDLITNKEIFDNWKKYSSIKNDEWKKLKKVRDEFYSAYLKINEKIKLYELSYRIIYNDKDLRNVITETKFIEMTKFIVKQRILRREIEKKRDHFSSKVWKMENKNSELLKEYKKLENNGVYNENKPT